MSKSRARFLSELLGTTGLVKKSKSALAGADEVIDLSTLPSIPNSKLTNASITIADHVTALGGSVTLNTGDIGEHTNYKYYTDARADARIAAADTGDLSEGSNLYFTNARVQTYISGNRSYGGITASGTHTFTANDVDFIVQDTTDSITNYIWRHHGNSALYLGSQDAIVNIRSPLQINATQVFDTSRNMSNIGTISSGRITTTGGLFVNAPSGNPDITLKTAGAGNNPLIRIQAATNYWDIQTLFSNTDDELDFRYNGASKLEIDKNGNTVIAGTISSGAITASTSGAVASFNRTDNDAIIELKRSGSVKGYIGANTSGDIKFYNNTAAGTLTISSAGNLGTTGTISSGAITSTGVSSFSNGTSVGNVELHTNSIGTDEAGILFQPNSAYRCVHPASMTSTPHTSDISLGWSNNKWKDIYLAGYVKADSGYQIGTTTVIDSSRNLTNIGTISSGAITSTGNSVFNGSGTGHAIVVNRTDGSQALRVNDTGEVIVSNNYLYASRNSGAGLYVQSTAIFRGSITNDGGNNLSISSGGSDIGFNSKNFTSVGTISSGAITSTGILTLDTSPAANGTGDLVVIPSLSSSSGVGFAGQVFGVNVKNAVHSTHNAPQVSSTWGGVTGATAIAIQADDNTYGQFQVWTAPQDSSADDLLTPKFYIAGSGNATFTGTLSAGAITTNNNFNMTGGYSVYLGSTSRLSSDNNGSFGINYGTTGGTATGSLVIYNNTTATSQLNRNGTIASNINGNNTVGGNIVLGPSSGSSKWYGITGRQYDSGTETEGYSLITGATSSGVNDVTIGGGLDEQNAATKVMIKAAANSTTRNGTEVVRVTTDGLDVRNNVVRITGTTVIDASRNLSNIGTITSAAAGTILDASHNLTNINNVYASGYRIGSTSVIDSSRNTNFNNSNAISFLSTNGYWVGGTRRIDASGNLENIGTISSGRLSPTGIQMSVDTGLYATNATLSYYSASNAVYLNGAGPSGWLRLNAAGTENDTNAINIFGSNAGANITFRTASTQRMNIDSGGNLRWGSANTAILDASRNFTNLGTISSADHTITSGTSGTNTTGLLFKNTDNPDAQAYIKKSAYYMHYNSNQNEGHHFTYSGTVSLLRLHGGNNGTRPNSVNITASNGLYVNDTQTIDSSRNLTNIGTISSGAITSTGVSSFSNGTSVGSQGEVIGNKWANTHENIYWNSKLISSSGYGNTPDKWFTQGGVTITSEHPYNKGFSTQYTNTQSAAHTTTINNATPSSPYWAGVYTTFPGATNFSGVQNSSIGGGWENGEGALMKMVYDGSGASNSTNAVRAKIWKNFFSSGIVYLRQSFFYYIESGEFSSGFFAGYNGYVGSTTHNFEDYSARHLFTNLQQWTYINHGARSYLGATYQQSTQNYLNGFGFTPGTAATVWIAIPGLTTMAYNDGKTINIHDATQQIGQG